MSFGIFEAVVSSEVEAGIAKQAAKDQFDAAVYDVREQLGPALFQASSVEEFRDRVACMKNDQSIYRIISPHLMPITGVVRRIVGKNSILETEFRTRIACGGTCTGPEKCEACKAREGRRTAEAEGVVNTNVTFKPSDGELKPKGNWEAYKSKVDQGAAEKVDRNFQSNRRRADAGSTYDPTTPPSGTGTTPGGGLGGMSGPGGTGAPGEAQARDQASQDFQRGIVPNPTPAQGGHFQNASRHYAVYAQWCAANGRSPARLSSLDAYAVNLSDAEYLRLANIITSCDYESDHHPKVPDTKLKKTDKVSRRRNAGEHSIENYPRFEEDPRLKRGPGNPTRYNDPTQDPDFYPQAVTDESGARRYPALPKHRAPQHQAARDPMRVYVAWCRRNGLSRLSARNIDYFAQGDPQVAYYLAMRAKRAIRMAYRRYYGGKHEDPMLDMLGDTLNEMGYPSATTGELTQMPTGRPFMNKQPGMSPGKARHRRSEGRRYATEYSGEGDVEKESGPFLGGGGKFPAGTKKDLNDAKSVCNFPSVKRKNPSACGKAEKKEKPLKSSRRRYADDWGPSLQGQEPSVPFNPGPRAPSLRGETTPIDNPQSGSPGILNPQSGKTGRRRRYAAPDYLQKADDALTQLLNQKAEEFQQTIAPLQQALQTVQQAEQIQQQQNPLNVLPPPGTVNVLPNGGPGGGTGAEGAPPGGGAAGGAPGGGPGIADQLGMPAPGEEDLSGAANALANPIGGGPPGGEAGGPPPPEQMTASRGRGGQGKGRGVARPLYGEAVNDLWRSWLKRQPSGLGRGGETDYQAFQGETGVGERAMNKLRKQRMTQPDWDVINDPRAVRTQGGTSGYGGVTVGSRRQGAGGQQPKPIPPPQPGQPPTLPPLGSDYWNRTNQVPPSSPGTPSGGWQDNSPGGGLQKQMSRRSGGVHDYDPGNPNQIFAPARGHGWEHASGPSGRPYERPQLLEKEDSGKTPRGRHEGRRKVAWSGWGPAQFPKVREVPGWSWDKHLNGYLANRNHHFACDCGESFPTPTGFRVCGGCGKQWNSYVIGTGGNVRSAAAEKFLVREIPARKEGDVIVASRKTAGTRAKYHFDPHEGWGLAPKYDDKGPYYESGGQRVPRSALPAHMEYLRDAPQYKGGPLPTRLTQASRRRAGDVPGYNSPGARLLRETLEKHRGNRPVEAIEAWEDPDVHPDPFDPRHMARRRRAAEYRHPPRTLGTGTTPSEFGTFWTPEQEQAVIDRNVENRKQQLYERSQNRKKPRKKEPSTPAPALAPEPSKPEPWGNYLGSVQLVDRYGNIHRLIDPGEFGEGEDDGMSTFRKPPRDWARRGDGSRWVLGPAPK